MANSNLDEFADYELGILKNGKASIFGNTGESKRIDITCERDRLWLTSNFQRRLSDHIGAKQVYVLSKPIMIKQEYVQYLLNKQKTIEGRI